MDLTRRGMLVGGAALVAASAARASGRDLLRIEGPGFGARWSVTIDARADGDAVAARVMAVVAQVDLAMSPYRPASEISRLNAALTRDWLPLSPAVRAVLREAQRVAQLTRGAFDPTLGGIVGRFGFGPIRQAPAGDFAGMVLVADGLRKDHPGQSLDLCGIAKGHALDRAHAALADLAQGDFLIEMGGELRGQGYRPDGRVWRVGVEDPRPGTHGFRHFVALHGEALATSGDRVNSYVLGAHRYGHIIDPRLGLPAESGLASVSVFAPQAVTADALATALFALGSEAGPALAVERGFAALFVVRDGEGLRDILTGGFSDRIL